MSPKGLLGRKTLQADDLERLSPARMKPSGRKGLSTQNEAMMTDPDPACPTEGDLSPAASWAEQAARQATDQEITPREKQTIAIETSRQEDA
jgi:hypothetical protein